MIERASSPLKQVAIIGGGVTGLSAAFYLEKARRSGAPLEYTLFEKSDRLGGALLTEHIDGCVVEAGADSFLTEKPWASELCHELGLGHQVVPSNDVQRKIFIVQQRKLIPVPSGMIFFVPTDSAAMRNSELFTADGKERILREMQLPAAKPLVEDESVGHFVERRFGNEVLQRVADPLLAGIYGGDAHKLSMRAVMPRFLEIEQQKGSLMRALAASQSSAESECRPLFTTLKNGMQELIEKLVAQLQCGVVHTRVGIRGVERNGRRWSLLLDGIIREFDNVIVATPAYAAAVLLNSVSPEAANMLRRIEYSSSATVALAYGSHSSGGKKLRELEGFGFLVPSTEKRRLLACTFAHNKFPDRAPPSRALLRLFFGGVRNEHVVDLCDEDLIKLALAELREILSVNGEPLFVRVHRWGRAMPQYNVGHVALARTISHEIRRLPSLWLVGSAFRGVGVSDCVRQGREAADELTAQLSAQRAT